MGQYEQDSFKDAWAAILTIIAALLICLCLTLLTGCKTKYITQEVPVIVHDRDSIVSVQQIHTHDTLMMRDSVFHFVKGDTVIIERWHQLQAINHYEKTDTLWCEKQVEVPVTVTKTEVKEVNKLYWWQKLLMWCGAGLLAFGGFKLYRKFRL